MTSEWNDRENGGSAPKTPGDEIAALLPFYATGSLDADETARVEEWLATDDGAASALANLEEERAATVMANEAIAPPAGALQRLMRDIEDEPAPKRATAAGLKSMLRNAIESLNALPASLAWGACGLLLALTIAQGIWLEPGPRDGPFTIASGERDIGGPSALVAFKSAATMERIALALEETGATIVSGPRAGGLFEVRFPIEEELAPAAERMRRLGEMKRVVRLLKPLGSVTGSEPGAVAE